MKILTDSALLDVAGGIEWNTLQMATALADRGHQIRVVYAHDGPLRTRYERAGITLDGPVDFTFDARHPLATSARFARSIVIARRFAPEVLWLNRVEHVQWAEAVAIGSRCRIVCQLHHPPRDLRESRLLGRVAHFVAVSAYVRDVWIAAGVSAKKITVIYNALPSQDYPYGDERERAEARERLGLPAKGAIVLSYGRISEDKGIGTLLDAWATLGLDSREALLVLVGSPSPFDVPALAARLARLAPGTVRYVPAQEDVVPYLHASDVVVVPSVAPEAFGRVASEALTSGRPVVATRAGALGEILAGPMSRFLVDRGDARQLASRISSLLNWREAEPHLGEECHVWATSTFPFEETTSRLERALARVAHAPRRGRV